MCFIRKVSAIALAALVLSHGSALAQGQEATPRAGVPDLRLFAIEIRVGPKWDSAKSPQEQPYFREHSANLKRLRESGSLLVGARYADKGLLVVAAGSSAEARSFMDQDPSIAAGTFSFEVHAFNLFYPGELSLRPGR